MKQASCLYVFEQFNGAARPCLYARARLRLRTSLLCRPEASQIRDDARCARLPLCLARAILARVAAYSVERIRHVAAEGVQLLRRLKRLRPVNNACAKAHYFILIAAEDQK